MTVEHREYERLVIPGDVYIIHRDNSIRCRIENISNYGAYLKVRNSVDISGIEIGDNITFSIMTPDVEQSDMSGQILRRSSDGRDIYLAVYFMQPYPLH